MNWLSLVSPCLKVFVGVDRDGCTRTRSYPTHPDEAYRLLYGHGILPRRFRTRSRVDHSCPW